MHTIFIVLVVFGILFIDFLFFVACHFRKLKEDNKERHVCELCGGRRDRQ